MSRARTTVLAPLLLLLLPVLHGGCGVGATGVEVDSPVAGSWRYEGTQTVPVAVTIRGTVTWSSVPGAPGVFEGNHQLFEEVPDGGVRPLMGTSSGELLSDTIADFDLEIAGARRRHVGALRGDSIAGDWVQFSGPNASGRFVLRRDPAGTVP
jgi:hypothetical protein